MLLIGEVVALKKLKMEKEKEGFPITSLREINTLLKSHHPNIINVRVSSVVTIETTLNTPQGIEVRIIGCSI